jgi:membrane protein
MNRVTVAHHWHWPHSKAEIVASARSWWACIDRTNTLGLAAQVAFWVFLALLPLAAVVGLVVSRFAIANAGVAASVTSSLPSASRALVADEMTRVANWNGGAVAPVAAVMFVWLASGGVPSVFDALELQVGVARPWWKKKLIALAMCVAISVGAAAIGFLTAGTAWIFHFIGRAVPPAVESTFSPVWAIARFAMALVIAASVVSGIYWIGTPPSARRRAPILPGALFAAIFNALCGWGYGLYLSEAGVGEGYEAGLAVIGVTLTSLYLVAVGVLVGASLNQHLAGQECSEPGRARPSAPAVQG